MSKENNKLILGIIIGVVAVALILLIYTSIKPKQEINEETEFKIISASWDTYKMVYEDDEGLVAETPRYEYDWDLICNCAEKPCVTSSWHITTQASEELICENTIDGIKSDSSIDFGGGQVILKGVSKTGFLEGETGNIYTNFDVTKDHEIIVCCKSHVNPKEEKICNTITLPAKC